MYQLMQALFSTMTETAQQPMTDFRRLCLEAEEKDELDAAPSNMDDGHEPSDPYAGNLKILMPMILRSLRMLYLMGNL